MASQTGKLSDPSCEKLAVFCSQSDEFDACTLLFQFSENILTEKGIISHAFSKAREWKRPDDAGMLVMQLQLVDFQLGMKNCFHRSKDDVEIEEKGCNFLIGGR